MARSIPISKKSVSSWISFPWKDMWQSLYPACASLWRVTHLFCLTSAVTWSSLRWKPGRAKVYNSGRCLWKSINWKLKIYLGLSIWTIPCSAPFCFWSKLTQSIRNKNFGSCSLLCNPSILMMYKWQGLICSYQSRQSFSSQRTSSQNTIPTFIEP